MERMRVPTKGLKGRPVMDAISMCVDGWATHQLRYPFLDDQAKSYTFPCDAMGRVDMDALDYRSLCLYLYARAMVGRELAGPTITVAEGLSSTERACKEGARGPRSR